jgi:hypothetical protein
MSPLGGAEQPFIAHLLELRTQLVRSLPMRISMILSAACCAVPDLDIARFRETGFRLSL